MWRSHEARAAIAFVGNDRLPDEQTEVQCMTSPTRWDPVREATSLRDAMNQLLEQAVMRSSYLPLSSQVGAGPGQMDVLELDGRYVVQIALPGVTPDDIELTVRQNTLTVRARLPEPLDEEQRKKGVYLLRELGAGELTRAISFPKDVNGDAVEAQCENGMLHLEIPVAEHAQAKRINVRGVHGAQSIQGAKGDSSTVVESGQSDARRDTPELTTASSR
jgi:HSP20 family protein